jgi:hypothetical protein
MRWTDAWPKAAGAVIATAVGLAEALAVLAGSGAIKPTNTRTAA